jgi:hypothetical protein
VFLRTSATPEVWCLAGKGFDLGVGELYKRFSFATAIFANKLACKYKVSKAGLSAQ